MKKKIEFREVGSLIWLFTFFILQRYLPIFSRFEIFSLNYSNLKLRPKILTCLNQQSFVESRLAIKIVHICEVNL